MFRFRSKKVGVQQAQGFEKNTTQRAGDFLTKLP